MRQLAFMPTGLVAMWFSKMDAASKYLYRHCQPAGGFTLLEVLVALVIVATAFGASLRAVGSLTQNSETLRKATLASWAAENHLVQIRLESTSPAYGVRRVACPQANLQLVCREEVLATPNVHFRRVEVRVYEDGESSSSLADLAHMVSDAR